MYRLRHGLSSSNFFFLGARSMCLRSELASIEWNCTFLSETDRCHSECASKREKEREREREMQIKKARSRGDRACRTTTVFSLQLYCVIHSVTMMHQRNAIEFFFKPTYPRNCVIGDHMINTYLSTSIYHSKKKVRGNTANRYFNNRSETVDKNEINESSD